MKKYIIFDLDGTLLKPHKVDIYELLLEEINKISPEKYVQAQGLIKNNYGIRAKKLLEMLDFPTSQVETIMNYLIGVVEWLKETWEFFPEVQEVIETLSSQFTLILSTVSSDEYAHFILEKYALHQNFGLILGSTHIQKWDDHIMRMREFLAQDDFTTQTIFIGDSDHDASIAEKHEIDFIRVPNGVDKTLLAEISNRI